MTPKIEKEIKQEPPQIRGQHFSQKPLVPPGFQADPSAVQNSPTVNTVRKALHAGVGDIDEDTNIEVLKYTIPYELLAGARLSGVPAKLRYKPLDGINTVFLNDLSVDNIDEGINSILDSLCYESKYEGFSHWELPTPEKVRSFINLRINSEGPIVDALSGICSKCGNVQIVLKVDLLKFDDIDMKAEYKEPWILKARMNGKEENFKARMIRSGDIQKAKNIVKNKRDFMEKMFPGQDLQEKENTLLQVLEYANTILEIKGSKPLYEEAIALCSDNLDIMNALTFFNDHFMYGLNMQAPHPCTNKKCPSNIPEIGSKETDLRGSLFQVPIQAALFAIQHGEEGVTKYFGDNK